MRIYTRQGDDGSTGLYRGGRTQKSSDLIDAIGEVDELNAWIGLANVYVSDSLSSELNLSESLATIQGQLFKLGTQLASVSTNRAAAANEPSGPSPEVQSQDVTWLEARIDELDGKLPPLTQFILPGGGHAAAHLQVARAVCRRVERRLAGLTEADALSQPEILAYINRLSDFFFVAARFANFNSNIEEPVWDSSK